VSEAKVRGVVATPPDLVGFVVRSVEYLLVSRFGKERGLADPEVRLFDPAAGPMTFLLSAWARALGRGYGGKKAAALLAGRLVPHSVGIELLPGPHARGVRAVERFLKKHGVSGDSPHIAFHRGDALAAPPLAELSRGVLVVLGNPPWRGHSENRGAWITGLLRGYVLPDGRRDEGYYRVDGEPLDERNSKWLQDDYVKFLRLSQWTVDQSGRGIVALILNHTCLDAPTFRGLRRSLIRTFEEIHVLDLHGNRRRREHSPDGDPDESVFPGIAQGAAVLLLVKKTGLRRRVMRADLYGTRRAKLRVLARADASAIPWIEIRPHAPGYLFAASDSRIEAEFREGLPLPEIFPVHAAGVITGRDALLTGISRRALEERVASLLAGGERTGVPAPQLLTPFLVRPFDLRHLFYAERLLARSRRSVMDHMRGGDNVGLLVARQPKEGFGALVAGCIAGHKVVSAFDTTSLFPLYLYPGSERVPNMAPALARTLGERYGAVPEPEAILGYVYGLLYSPAYRRRYRDVLRRQFPRIVFPGDPSHFAAIAELGRELAAIHLLQDPRLTASSIRIEHDPPRRQVRRRGIEYREGTGRLSLAAGGICFEGLVGWHLFPRG
jgi:predicted helicase